LGHSQGHRSEKGQTIVSNTLIRGREPSIER